MGLAWHNISKQNFLKPLHIAVAKNNVDTLKPAYNELGVKITKDCNFCAEIIFRFQELFEF